MGKASAWARCCEPACRSRRRASWSRCLHRVSAYVGRSGGEPRLRTARLFPAQGAHRAGHRRSDHSAAAGRAACLLRLLPRSARCPGGSGRASVLGRCPSCAGPVSLAPCSGCRGDCGAGALASVPSSPRACVETASRAAFRFTERCQTTMGSAGHTEAKVLADASPHLVGGSHQRGPFHDSERRSSRLGSE
jgi:hypothetical protein